MRLLSFEVNGLFERFDYRIDFNQEDRVTILHGPNGFGKTTLLRLLRHILGSRFESLLEMPFRTMTLHFDDSTMLRLRLKAGPRPEAGPRRRPARTGNKLIVQLRDKEGTIGALPEGARERIARTADRYVPGLERIGHDRWINTRTGSQLTFDELLTSFGDHLPAEVRETIDRQGGEFFRTLRDFLSQVRVFVIDTQRLISNRNLEIIEDVPRARHWVHHEEQLSSPAVVTYAGLLRDELREHVRRYGVRASELDRSLPSRILSGQYSDLAEEDLRERYNAVVEKRQAFMAAGLLEKQEGEDIAFPENLERLEKHVIRIYLDDMESKLSVFKGFAERVQLFTTMINGLFKYKNMEVSTDHGFRFATAEGKSLSPDVLSSGEQHQLVLLFDLLFRVGDGALILVDEPEISLHVEWQQQVLKNFHAISQLRDLDFLIATHSPDIIHDRWDLTIALGEGSDA